MVEKEKIEELELQVKELKRTVLNIQREHEIEISNIKINYLASIMIVLSFLMFVYIGNIEAFGITFTPIMSTLILGILIFAFFIKEAFSYAKFISRKFVFGIK
jgi:hypothetical protein